MTIKFVGETVRILKEKGRQHDFEIIADKSIELLQGNLELKQEMLLEIIECDLELEHANMLKYFPEFDKILQENDSVAAKEARMNILLKIGEAYRHTRHYEKTLEYAYKAENIAQELKDKKGEVLCCGNLGNAYLCVAEYDKAIECYQKGLAISIEIGDRSGIANNNGNLGTVYDSIGQHKKAIEYYEKSLSVIMAIGDRLGIASVNGNLGNAYNSLGDHKKAIEFFQKGLTISAEIGDRLGLASITRNLGIAYFCLGDYKKAIECYQKALAISTEIGNQFEMAHNNGNLGNVYFSLGEYERAIEYHENVLTISTEIGDFSAKAKSNGSLGNTYFSLGEYDNAILYYKEAVALSSQIGELPSTATLVGNLGNTYYSLAKYDKAIRYYETALAISTEIGDRSGAARNNGNLGNAYACLGEYEKAITYYKEGREISTAIGDRSVTANNDGNLGNAYLSLGQYENAIELFTKSLETSVEIGNPVIENSSLKNIGFAYFVQGSSIIDKPEALKMFQDAASYLKRSVICVDQIFSSLDVDQNKISFTKGFFQSYVTLMCCFILLKRFEAALLVIDLGKAKALHAFMEKQKRPEGDDMIDYTHQTWERIDNNEEKMQTKEIERDLELKTDNSSVLVYAFDHDNFLNIWVVNEKGDVTTFKQSEPLKDFVFARLKMLLTPLVNLDQNSSFHKLDSEATPDGQIMVAPVQLGKKPENDKSVDTSIQAKAICLDKSKSRPLGDESTFSDNTSEAANSSQNILQVLHQVLIHPIKNLIIGTKLIIVPDEFLFFVPFCSLLNGDGFPVSENFSIQITPSLHTLVSSKTRSRDPSLGIAFFVGNPSVGKVSLRGEPIEPRVLPSATGEVQYLASLFEAHPLVEGEATKERVLKCIQGASIIHIAAHGDKERGEILLAPNPNVEEQGSSIPKEESYLLKEKDIMDINISARLVVLCCCHTGRGEISSEGVIGLTRAFLAAGARSVLATLWPIHDEGTKEFMKNFYDEVCNETSVCEALKKTMNLFQKHEKKDFCSLKIWAPFTVYGEDVKFTQHDIEEIIQKSREVSA